MPSWFLGLIVVADVIGCGAGTDPMIDSGPFGASCAGTRPCVPPSTWIQLRFDSAGLAPMEREITIDATGLVTFERVAGHGIPERHERTIDDSEVSSLLWKLHAADFFSMPRRFDGELCETFIDDSGSPTAHLIVVVEERSREVDWVGGCSGPSVSEISRLVRAVEETAGVDEWTDRYW